ncbi:MAG TPA: glycosyl hydrolase family 28-related protein [Herpetosiphonaceae bacterium]|nr:glycosyl hydrolase family 28-related protein [Herpetosiphonaceae bacterium]
MEMTEKQSTRATSSDFHHGLNVKDFGAVGDGSTDDTAAIQAAIDRAEAEKIQGPFPQFFQELTVFSRSRDRMAAPVMRP